MDRPLSQRDVQSVVVGFVYIGQTIDLCQIREFAVVRASRLFSRAIRRTKHTGSARARVSHGSELCWGERRIHAVSCPGGRLVDVSKSQKLGAMVANIGNIYGKVIRDGPLD